MQIYEGRLVIKRKTRATVVYGNADLPAQYIPKTVLKKAGKEFPLDLIFTIKTLSSTEGKEGE